MPVLFKIFDLPKLNPSRSKIFDVFDQNYNVPDVGPGKAEWATKRCLEKVFDHHNCKENGFNFSNTLIIDSCLSKVADYPKNSIVIQPYEAKEVLTPTEDQSKILMTVRDYVFSLVDSTSSVPEYIENHPPAFQLKDENLTGLEEQMSKLNVEK